ncbi:MAG TPA: GNAT family N-acetyltransferase [Thermoanaerobaculia bacterium]|nr:GNAT family N-acetyltransferase [Thermoanaerobaculia bacterium]
MEIERAAFPPSIAYSRRDLRRLFAARRCRTLVAEVDGAVAGFVTGCREPRGIGRVRSLDVAPERQGEGIGSRLLAAIEEWLREQGSAALLLETAPGARGFYERHGYRIDERLIDYYREGLDAFRMVKMVKPVEDRGAPAVLPSW